MEPAYFICSVLLFLYFELYICLSQKPPNSLATEEQQCTELKFKITKIDKIIHEILGDISDQDFYNKYDIDLTPKSNIKAKDCTELKQKGINKSGIYKVWSDKGNSINEPAFNVYCDMETDGGGWTVFQRRGDFGHPKDYFLRNWKNYSEGFGNLKEDFWLGNDKLHLLTNQGSYSLRVDMNDKEGNKRYAQYSSFKVGNEKDLYQLEVSGYSGDAGDSLISHHNNRKFSTIDKDNDEASSSDCATTYKGAWWYNNCYDSNLNGLYLNGPHTSYADGIEWHTFKGIQYSLPNVEMKMRRN